MIFYKKQYMLILCILLITLFISESSFSNIELGKKYIESKNYSKAIQELSSDVKFFKYVRLKYYQNPESFYKYTLKLAISHELLGDAYNLKGNKVQAYNNYKKALSLYNLLQKKNGFKFIKNFSSKNLYVSLDKLKSKMTNKTNYTTKPNKEKESVTVKNLDENDKFVPNKSPIINDDPKYYTEKPTNIEAVDDKKSTEKKLKLDNPIEKDNNPEIMQKGLEEYSFNAPYLLDSPENEASNSDSKNESNKITTKKKLSSKNKSSKSIIAKLWNINKKKKRKFKRKNAELVKLIIEDDPKQIDRDSTFIEDEPEHKEIKPVRMEFNRKGIKNIDNIHLKNLSGLDMEKFYHKYLRLLYFDRKGKIINGPQGLESQYHGVHFKGFLRWKIVKILEVVKIDEKITYRKIDKPIMIEKFIGKYPVDLREQRPLEIEGTYMITVEEMVHHLSASKVIVIGPNPGPKKPIRIVDMPKIPPIKVKLYIDDGSKVSGWISQYNGKEYVIETVVGPLEIEKDMIVNIDFYFKEGMRVRIILNDGVEVTGRIQDLISDRMTLDTNDNQVEVSLSNIVFAERLPQ